MIQPAMRNEDSEWERKATDSVEAIKELVDRSDDLWKTVEQVDD